MNSLQDFTEEKSYSFRDYLTRVFNIILLGLGISFGVAYAMVRMGGLYFLARMNMPIFVIFVIQMGLAWIFSSQLYTMKKSSAWLCYILYCSSLGVTFSVLPFVYDGRSIFFALAMTTVLFVLMAIIGHTTNIDLTKYASYFMIGLIMLIVITLINFFFIHSETMDLIMAYVGVVLFLGITAYDMQRLRAMYLNGSQDPELYEKMMLFGAFQLYLDFVNLFIRILRIFGRRRR